MQKTFESLKDNDIEIIVIAYLLKHPDLIDTHFEYLDNSLFANAENLKIYQVLEDFHKSQKNISINKRAGGEAIQPARYPMITIDQTNKTKITKFLITSFCFSKCHHIDCLLEIFF